MSRLAVQCRLFGQGWLVNSHDFCLAVHLSVSLFLSLLRLLQCGLPYRRALSPTACKEPNMADNR